MPESSISETTDTPCLSINRRQVVLEQTQLEHRLLLPLHALSELVTDAEHSGRDVIGPFLPAQGVRHVVKSASIRVDRQLLGLQRLIEPIKAG